MTETKIPMQIFTSYEALTQYYGDRDDCELGLYVSDNELLVGHVPTAYSFNPQYFTGYNELLPDYAPPSVIDYTVTAESNNSTYGYVTGAGTYPQHSEITLNAYAYYGYKFDKWSNDVETSAYTFAVEENVDLTAYFVDNTYTLTLSANYDDRGTVEGAGTYVAGTTVTATAIPNNTYIFSDWKKNGVEVYWSTPYTFVLNENTELVAEFFKIPYTITATPNNVSYGSTSGSGTYPVDTLLTVTATAETGYRFVNWTENGVEVSTNANYTFTVTEDRTLVANFEAATANITISAAPAGYGSVDAAGSTVIGDNYTVMAEANTGYIFVNWTENGVEVSTSANYTFTVTGDRTLVANFENPLEEPFYVENITNADETLSITKNKDAAKTITIEYSTDRQTWNTLGTTSTTALTRTIAPGEKLYLRCNTVRWTFDSYSNSAYNTITGTSKVGGNIMSLLYGSNFTGNETTFPYAGSGTDEYYVFNYLFKDNTTLQSANKLLLPATTLKYGCYSAMFYGCTSLTTTPILPATTLDEKCYVNMFAYCRALTSAPALPATILSNSCYESMFFQCTSLTTAPILPATTLVKDCYRSMFGYSSNLNYIKCLATDTTAQNCLYIWVQGVSQSGTFVKAAGVTWPEGTSGIPTGWTVVEEAVS